jgi:uncharacterized protein (TIGR03086 family)
MSCGFGEGLYVDARGEVMTIDLKPAVERTADVVRGVRDDQLQAPTPCPAYTLGDLLDHVGGLSFAFTAAATKDVGEIGDQGPSADASRLGDDWRARIPADLAALADAWRDPEAWTGMTKAGGVDLPGEVAGMVALNEVVIHGWDVARASGQPYEPDTAALEGCHAFVSQFAGPDADRGGMFGPVVDVPADAPLLDRVIGLSGRDPAWSPSATGTGGG